MNSTPGEELGGVDQAPVDIFERLAPVADTGKIPATDFDLVSRGLSGQNAKIECTEGSALVGCGVQDLAQDRAGLGLGSIIDQGAIHQEQGLGDCPHDVVVGNGRIDSEQAIEKQPLAAGAPDGACLLPNLGGQTGSRGGFLGGTLGCRLALLAFWITQTQSGLTILRVFAWGRVVGARFRVLAGLSAFIGRQCQGLDESIVDLVSAEPAWAARGKRGLARLVGRRADAPLVSLGVENRAEQPANVVSPFLPLLGQGIEHFDSLG